MLCKLTAVPRVYCMYIANKYLDLLWICPPALTDVWSDNQADRSIFVNYGGGYECSVDNMFCNACWKRTPQVTTVAYFQKQSMVQCRAK